MGNLGNPKTFMVKEQEEPKQYWKTIRKDSLLFILPKECLEVNLIKKKNGKIILAMLSNVGVCIPYDLLQFW